MEEGSFWVGACNFERASPGFRESDVLNVYTFVSGGMIYLVFIQWRQIICSFVEELVRWMRGQKKLSSFFQRYESLGLLKVKVFSWLLLHNRILTQWNLFSRRIISTLKYSFSSIFINYPIESVCHLSVKCPFFRPTVVWCA